MVSVDFSVLQYKYYVTMWQVNAGYIYFYWWFQVYGYCLLHIPISFFPFPPVFPFPLSFTFFPPEVPQLRMWPQLFCLMLQKTCADTVNHTVSAKMTSRRPPTCAHPSKYWPSTKLLDLGDRSTGHLVPNAGYIFTFSIPGLQLKQCHHH